ncbi:MAG: hypothetical protein IJO28_02570 [Oscillospiraceae bacterium]|nr:hypothetical protein [Oscillospiraceae bacterium]
MKEKINTSRPILRRGLSLLMALSMVLSLGASPVSALSAEAVKKDEVQTGVVQIGFDTAADAEKFDLYHSSSGGFAVQSGKLTPTGTAGEFKAIYKSSGKKIKSVSVELHPVGSNGPIFGGLYLNASDIADGQDRVNGLYVGVEAHHTGWADAPNRIDLVTGSFPGWKELGRIISETGAGNNLFSGGVKEPLLLKVDIHGNQLTSTVSLVRDPSKKITSTYVYQGAGDLSTGSVGIRSQFNNACYDNFLVEYEHAAPEQNIVTLTETVDFDAAASADRFDLYTSSSGGFAVANGKLTPSGVSGEFKAIYKKPEGAKIREITVDIHPGTSGTLVGGLYINAKNPGNPVDQIDALNINVDSNHSGWSDAPNRIDLVVGSFPRWTEIYRLISETGNRNNLFSGGVKEALKLKVAIDGNRLNVTLSLLRDPGKSVSFSYVYQGAGDLSAGDVGIRSPFHDAAYDNFTVRYTVEQIPEEPTTEEPTTEEPTTEEPTTEEPTTEEPTTEEPTTEEPTTEEPTEPDVSLEPTDLVDFENTDSSGKFSFYHSSNGGFAVQDGKLVPVGDAGEFKAIYKDTNASFSYVSMDIYPNAKGINGGLYLDVTSADHPIDQVNALYVGIESDFPHGNEPFWPDAPNRLDLVVGKFPQWQELHRAVSETGIGNNLFTGGVKEPVNLSVAINGNELTITVRLISDPARYVTTTYIYAEGQDISLGNVGIRSNHSDASYDNFAVIYTQAEQDKEDDTLPEEPTTEPTEPVTRPEPTDLVDFENTDSSGKFSFYHSSNGGFAVQDGKLVPAGEAGEFKAIYKDTNASFSYVSVDIYPGEKGINGGLYIDGVNAGHAIDEITGLYIGIESNFPHEGEAYWEDAPNRLDLVVGKFPQWQELHRAVSETGIGNNLFANGVKEPVNLSVAINGNELTITVRLISDPARYVTTTYIYAEGQDISLGNVGIRSAHCDAAYDNFAVIYEQVEQDKDPDDIIPEEPTTEPTEPVTRPAPTDTVDFENADSGEKFNLYHSSNGGFAVQDGKLVPSGEAGEFKAIYKDTNASFSYVSVDIYPGQDGIRGGLYLDVTDVDHPVDQANALYVGIESDFPHGEEPAWEDAPNRLDLVIGKFPQWIELHRVVSETGAGNSLFTGGVKEPVNLSVAMDGNELTVTVSLLSDPSRSVTTTYVYEDGQDMSLGNVGIRSYFCDAAYDDFAVVYEQAEQDKEDDTLPEEPTTTEPTEPVTRPEPTDVVDFDDALSREQFHFYHSSNGGFAVEDGKLVPAGEAGEFKAIYKDTNANFSYVSVDIYPGQDGIRGGLYLDVTDVGHGQDQITGLYVGIESDFPHGEEPAWEDAPNRLDLVIGKFPQWAELHRAVSETGAGNNLFTGGVKEPINLSVAVRGKKLTVTVSLLSDPSRYLTTTYVCADAKDLGLGNVGIRSQYCNAAYDNFFVVYEQVQEDKEQDILIPELEPTDVVDFGKKDDAQKFDFYHSSQGGFAVRDGKLMPVGEEGEFKAIYRDGGSTIQAVSVDIYPGESGQINSGIYIGTSTVEDGVDRIKGLVVMVESSFSGWDDAVNRIDLVVGRFPIWKELHRCTSETGNGNALFAGAKEPLNLSVFLDGNTLTVKLSLISNPEKFVTTTYTYNGATELPTHNVGLRSAFNDAAFDNFAVRTLEGGGSNDPEAPGSDGGNGTTTGGTGMTPDTGDAFRPELSLTLMLLSIAAIVALVWKKNKFISQEVSQ